MNALHADDLVIVEAFVNRHKGQALKKKDSGNHWLVRLEWNKLYLLRESIL